ncbi:FecR family protein [Chryseosolibacter indicus]|uniref:FecR domain-containing protein n=1 Tax=Chryseosolibacter indicus TaxID=2782351 RepID=A0ABS5VSS1_9BACT|nr:FecR domain-containing protein [Chryseosolibacter indicus]MBT1704078.1 FecR domain-containing protein [Chryseosolibacter indicus]
MNEFEFDRLIELYQKGLLTGKEKKLVEDWLNKSGAEEDTSYSQHDKQMLKLKIFDQIGATDKSRTTFELEHKKENASPVSSWVVTYKIAASLTLIAVFVYLILQYTADEVEKGQMLQASSSGNVRKVILADGTLVWLKGNSKLSYPSTFSEKTRNVSLQGEALFEVAKDVQHPFIISCGELTTTVLGTSFNIKSSDNKIEVVVLTGKVSLTSADNEQGVIVLPDEKVVYDGHKKELAVTKQRNEEKLVAVSGTEYIMSFEDSRMGEVIQRIEQKFNVRISLSDVNLNNCMITADFSDQSLESTLSMISQALNFTYSIQGKSVMLDGKGCEMN